MDAELRKLPDDHPLLPILRDINWNYGVGEVVEVWLLEPTGGGGPLEGIAICKWWPSHRYALEIRPIKFFREEGPPGYQIVKAVRFCGRTRSTKGVWRGWN